MSTISKPLLPPKVGYVEVINENGEHVYKPTPKTIEKQNEASMLMAAFISLETSLAITDEVAIELYEAQAEQEEINMAQDDALIEIYETIGG